MNWHAMSAAQATERLRTDRQTGLSGQEAAQRLEEYGPNTLKQKRKKTFLERLLEQFSDFMVIVLLIAAGISFVIAMFGHEGDWLDPIVILAIVLINAVLGVVQESRAEAAIEALQKIAAPEARVRRGGHITHIPANQVVPGEILVLEPGDLIPADARLIHATGLSTDESSLTGESIPVEKEAVELLDEKAPLGERHNMVFSGTIIAAGRGEAVVTETGMESQLGRIAQMIQSEEAGMTPLQERLSHIGKILGIGALCICVVVFVLGLLQRMPVLDMFMLSISLAVAAIPEGLPAIVTISLAIGVQRMVKSNAIIRRLPAVETLGSATVICSDKTGTLTQNNMTVVSLAGPDGEIREKDPQWREILTLAALCNNAQSEGEGFIGSATETALVVAAKKAGEDKQRLDRDHPRIGEVPFSSTRKRMSTLHRMPGGGLRLIVKGAPDMLLKSCSHYTLGGAVRPLDPAMSRRIEGVNADMAGQALRVLGVAWRDIPTNGNMTADESLESNLCFAGLIGMIDPPRPEATDAVLECRRAGIRPVMITGDHLATAEAIARQMHILAPGDRVVSGSELDHMSDSDLARAIEHCSVFARVSPEHKVRIVKSFQARGGVVAMTGDGVNDAPALKAADIGCAMGKTGTDVARASADMVLTDDNFSTIVAAVREGRGIYDNIRKAVHFLLSCNIGELLTIFVAFLLGMPSPLLAIQLLWVNVVTDSLPALALSVERPDSDIMRRQPIRRNQSLFAGGLWGRIAAEGALIGVLSMVAFLVGRTFEPAGSYGVARTMAFAVLALSQLVHAFNMRSGHSIFSVGFMSNKYMVGAFFACIMLQTVVIAFPPLAAVFKTVPLDAQQWLIVAALALVPFPVIEIQKFISRFSSPKTTESTIKPQQNHKGA